MDLVIYEEIWFAYRRQTCDRFFSFLSVNIFTEISITNQRDNVDIRATNDPHINQTMDWNTIKTNEDFNNSLEEYSFENNQFSIDAIDLFVLYPITGLISLG